MSNKYVKLENLAFYDEEIKEYIQNKINGGGVEIYEDYSKLPLNLTEDAIAYCKNDYVDTTDVDNHVTRLSGLYFYDSSIVEWVFANENYLTTKDKEKLQKSIDDIDARSVIGKGLSTFLVSRTDNLTSFDITSGTVIPFNKVIHSYGTNIGFNSDNNSITLKANKSYKLVGNIMATNLSDVCSYGFYNLTDGVNLQGTTGTNSSSSNWLGFCESIAYVTPTTDIEVQLRIFYVSSTTANVSIVGQQCRIHVEETSRTHIENPVQLTNDEYGIEDAPVGHILNFMGNTPPKHYLSCDGTIYNIEDYPYLAKHILDEFGSYNYFGGNGIDTFAVPDLRGEFLRGTGVNSHQNQGDGSNVGEHQDATENPEVRMWADGNGYYEAQIFSKQVSDSGLSSQSNNIDKPLKFTEKSTFSIIKADNQIYDFDTYVSYTSRPTNTSVLYCIKYEPTYYMNYTPSYVGFDKTVLFDGKANSVGDYVLSDDISNYDLLIVTVSNDASNMKDYSRMTNTIPVFNITGFSREYCNSRCTVDNTIAVVQYGFNSNIMSIGYIDSGSYNSLQVNSVVGIKGKKIGDSDNSIINATSEDIDNFLNELFTI